MGRTEDRFSLFLKEALDTKLLDEIKDWIATNLEPDDVYPKHQLEDWAKANGFKKED